MEQRVQGWFCAAYIVGVGLGIGLSTLVQSPSPEPVKDKLSPDVRAVTTLVTGPDPITLPFKPPTRRLRYAYEMQLERDSGVESVKAVEELSFRPGRDGGSTLRWRTRSFSVDAPGPAATAATRLLRLTRDQPLQVAVSARGEPKALLGAGSKAFEEAVLENPRLLLRDFGPLLPGKTVAGATTGPSKVDTGHIRYVTQTELRRHVPGKSAEVVVTAVADPRDARRVMATIIDPILAAIPDPAQRKAAGERIAEMGEPSISDEAVITLDLPSGLPRSVTWRKRFYMPGRGTTVETRRFKRL